MSATNRKKKTPNKEENTKRAENDFYPTPEWAIHRFLEKAEWRFPKGVWLEPCAGTGAIIKAMRTANIKNNLTPFCAVELQAGLTDALLAIPGVLDAHTCNFLEWDFVKENKTASVEKIDAIITNPPYSLAFDMIKHSLNQTDSVYMLLRLNFLASETRSGWMKENTPDVYVLPNRPSFRGKGTDACEYAWFCWDKHTTGKITILDSTPKNVRLAEKRKLLNK
jgi:hypothetical protein